MGTEVTCVLCGRWFASRRGWHKHLRACLDAKQRQPSSAISGRRGEARRPFRVTDDRFDAPDGAEVCLDQMRGWYRRVGEWWQPIEAPMGRGRKA